MGKQIRRCLGFFGICWLNYWAFMIHYWLKMAYSGLGMVSNIIYRLPPLPRTPSTWILAGQLAGCLSGWILMICDGFSGNWCHNAPGPKAP